MMKNVYSLGGYQIQKTKFRLNIKYLSDTTGTQINYLPVPGLNNQSLLQVMNLDRIDSNEESNPDGFFDFIEGYTIISATGKGDIPRGRSRSAPISPKKSETGNRRAVCLSGTIRLHACGGAAVCRQEQIHPLGRISGIVRLADTTQCHECAARLGDSHGGGVQLTENSDYTVDYAMGIVTITNQSIIDSGRISA